MNTTQPGGQPLRLAVVLGTRPEAVKLAPLVLAAQAVRAGGIWALKLSKALRHRAFDLGMGRG